MFIETAAGKQFINIKLVSEIRISDNGKSAKLNFCGNNHESTTIFFDTDEDRIQFIRAINKA